MVLGDIHGTVFTEICLNFKCQLDILINYFIFIDQENVLLFGSASACTMKVQNCLAARVVGLAVNSSEELTYDASPHPIVGWGKQSQRYP